MTRTSLCRALPLVPLLFGLAACGSSDSSATATTARFAVFSDPHLYDATNLGSSGTALEAYLASDRKMLVQSEEILDAALADLKGEGLDFVLVSGDLTKDG